MLTPINLDDEKFEELSEEARNMAASVYPEWTDFNYHDPGITIVELFAFMKEIAQYRMNYIGEAHLKKYLKLMGISRRPMTPAQMLASVDCVESMQLPPLARFFAAGVCFENMEPKYLIAGDVRGCLYEESGRWAYVEQGHMGFKIPPFGKNPMSGQCFYLFFDEPLPANIKLSLFADVYNGHAVRRNAVGGWEDFIPPARLELDYLSEDGWQSCRDFSDGTFGMIQSGWIEFLTDIPMTAADTKYMNGTYTGKYVLRLRLTEASYNVYPVITGIRMNCLKLYQTRHYAACLDLECRDADGCAECFVPVNEVTSGHMSLLVPEAAGGENADRAYHIFENYTVRRERDTFVLTIGEDQGGKIPKKVRLLAWELLFDISQSPGVGDGLPFQTFALEGMKPEASSFLLMIEEAPSSKRLIEWQQVDDFSSSGPQDCHYVLDTERKQLIFGDCFRGMAPRGRIFIGQYAACEGSRGNVRAGTFGEVEEGYEQISVTNDTGAFGGSDAESIDDCFMDARAALHKNYGLVTNEDYEAAVRKTPGLMIENCKVIDSITENTYEPEQTDKMMIVVKPFSLNRNPKLSEIYRKNIAQWLEPRRLIGTNIVLVSPEYLRLEVFVECSGRNNYIFDKQMIVGALDRYFAPFSSEFGKIISQSEVYEILDRMESVEVLEALSIDVTGNHVERSLGGDIILPPNGLISPEDIHYNVNIN